MFILALLLVFTVCVQAEAEKISPAAKSGEDVSSTSAQQISKAENLADILCGIQECDLDIEKNVRERYKEYTLVFTPDDFVPQDIRCANVFSSCLDGRENQEIQALYDAAGEQWEYLWYVEYDYNGDGEQDYIVLHDCPDRKEGVDIGGGDIWLSKDFRRRWKLPETTYLTGGTWQEPQLYMMLLSHRHGFAVYRDYEKQEMALYGWGWWKDSYGRVRARTIVEETSGVTIRQTSFSVPYDDSDPVRLEITGKGKKQQVPQIIMVDRVRSRLSEDEPNCRAWDGNNDGYEDILYYAGYDGGSGGVWNFYYLLCWSEEKQEYEIMELPRCVLINYEEHKLYSRGQSGAPHQYYEIYGLQDGEYRLEKELELLYETWRDDVMVDIARYSEYGEEVEETDITGLDWQEIKRILEEKYPEFTFWREG